MSNVRFASNEIDDFEQGGLYPGGSGVIKEIYYTLWDYDGKQPKDSALAVYCKFQPTDGSNENKLVNIYWSVGDASAFAPDPEGGRLVILKAREKQSDNSNWAVVLKALANTCGLEKGKLSTEKGIRALELSEMTFTRQDQKEREGLPEKQAEGEKKKNKSTMLVPTRAKFPWEKGSRAAASAPSAKPAASTSTATPAASNGSGTVTTDLSLLIKEIVIESGGSIEYKNLVKELLGRLADVDRTIRTRTIKDAKDPAKIAALAEENGWTFDGKDTDGKLSGELIL